MGLQPGDIVTEAGAIKVQHMGALMFWFNKMEIGKKVYFSINRDGHESIKSGVIMPRPYERSTSENEDIYDAYNISSGTIRTIVNKPPGLKKGPVILFIQDYTCHSVDMAGREYHPYLILADEFVKQGFVFVRIEKLGLGDSKTELSCYKSGFNEEGKIFSAGME
jgi:hypothetical protein